MAKDTFKEPTKGLDDAKPILKQTLTASFIVLVATLCLVVIAYPSVFPAAKPIDSSSLDAEEPIILLDPPRPPEDQPTDPSKREQVIKLK